MEDAEKEGETEHDDNAGYSTDEAHQNTSAEVSDVEQETDEVNGGPVSEDQTDLENVDPGDTYTSENEQGESTAEEYYTTDAVSADEVTDGGATDEEQEELDDRISPQLPVSLQDDPVELEEKTSTTDIEDTSPLPPLGSLDSVKVSETDVPDAQLGEENVSPWPDAGTTDLLPEGEETSPSPPLGSVDQLTTRINVEPEDASPLPGTSSTVHIGELQRQYLGSDQVSLLAPEASVVKLAELEKRFDDLVTPLPPEASAVGLDELEDKFEDLETPFPAAASVEMAGMMICLVDHDGQEGVVEIDVADENFDDVEDLSASAAIITRGRRVSVSSQIRGVGDGETDRVISIADEKRKQLESLIDEQNRIQSDIDALAESMKTDTRPLADIRVAVKQYEPVLPQLRDIQPVFTSEKVGLLTPFDPCTEGPYARVCIRGPFVGAKESESERKSDPPMHTFMYGYGLPCSRRQLPAPVKSGSSVCKKPPPPVVQVVKAITVRDNKQRHGAVQRTKVPSKHPSPPSQQHHQRQHQQHETPVRKASCPTLPECTAAAAGIMPEARHAIMYGWMRMDGHPSSETHHKSGHTERHQKAADKSGYGMKVLKSTAVKAPLDSTTPKNIQYDRTSSIYGWARSDGFGFDQIDHRIGERSKVIVGTRTAGEHRVQHKLGHEQTEMRSKSDSRDLTWNSSRRDSVKQRRCRCIPCAPTDRVHTFLDIMDTCLPRKR